MKCYGFFFIFSLLLLGWNSLAENQVMAVHPLSSGTFIEVQNTKAPLFVQKSGAGAPLSCFLKGDSKGSIVASNAKQYLVVFDEASWKKACGGQLGFAGKRMAWISKTDVTKVKGGHIKNYGDRCSAYETLERAQLDVIPSSRAEAEADECVDCIDDPIYKIAKLYSQVEAASAPRKREKAPVASSGSKLGCLENRSEAKNNPKCGMKLMVASAMECSTGKKGPDCLGGKADCSQNLRRQGCIHSPWRQDGIKERFQKVMQMSQKHAPRFGIQPAVIPCVAAVETGFLEPQSKAGLACQNFNRNRYHGLGMITFKTLAAYLNPRVSFDGTSKEGGHNKAVEFGPFRSSLPYLQKLSLYACPEKLHEYLAADPELQVELMAYTLAEKKHLSDGDEYKMIVNYNANEATDDNGQPHKYNYAKAVQSCASCIRSRQKSPDSAVECLSITTRSGGSNPFHMKIDSKIITDFEKYKQMNCGEGK